MTEYIRKKNSFTSSLLWSVAAHVFLFLSFSVKNIYFPSSIDQYIPAIKVDIIALPDKQLNKIKNTHKKTVSIERPKINKKKQSPKVNLKQKNRQQQAIDKIKAQRAIEALKRELLSKTPKQKFKGNTLAAGTQLTGLNKLEHDDYQTQIDIHVKQFWELPEWLAQSDLKTLALVRLNSQGFVIEKKILRSSDNPEYDEIILNTIQRASPFPPPSKKFIDIVKIKGITLGFPE